MKRHLRRNPIIYLVQVTDNKWDRFLDKIEVETGLEVDSAYRRRPEEYIDLIDTDTGQIFVAEITQYFNGDFEFRSDNMFRK